MCHVCPLYGSAILRFVRDFEILFLRLCLIGWLLEYLMCGVGPHLVLPLTVEPSKLRLCHDERYLNLWIRDLPIQLDHLPDLPDLFSLGIFRRLLTIRAATNMRSSIPHHVPILVLNGMMCFSYFVPYRLAGRRVPLSIITWVYSLLVQLVCLVFLCRSTSMIVMLASFFVLLLMPV